jgi:hypothetical protein
MFYFVLWLEYFHGSDYRYLFLAHNIKMNENILR